MTQPIGSGSGRSYDLDAWQSTAERTASDRDASSAPGRAARDMCMHADTVIEGYLCDEPTVTSNACRSPKNDVDAFVCDDKKMKGLQEDAWDATKSTVKMIFQVILGGWGK